MATIIKGKNPNKPYTVRYFHEKHQRERSFRTWREAQDFKIKFEVDNREQTFVDPRAGKILFVDYATRWIASLDRTEGTKAAYRSALKSHVAEPFKLKTLAQVAGDREAVWDLISGMDVSATRKVTALRVVTGPVSEAVTAGILSKHRLDGLSIRKDGLRKPDIIEASKAQLELLAAGLNADEAVTVWLMRGAGLRVSEALAVREDGFRDDGRTLRVHEQVSRDGSYGPLKRRRPGEYRDVPVPAWLWAKVQEHIAEHGTRAGYLTGGATYAAYHHRFSVAAGKAGLAGMTEHNLRHLFASTLLKNLVPITDVSEWLGHRDINVTYAVYSHLLPDSWERGRKVLDSALA